MVIKFKMATKMPVKLAFYDFKCNFDSAYEITKMTSLLTKLYIITLL